MVRIATIKPLEELLEYEVNERGSVLVDGQMIPKEFLDIAGTTITAEDRGDDYWVYFTRNVFLHITQGMVAEVLR